MLLQVVSFNVLSILSVIHAVVLLIAASVIARDMQYYSDYLDTEVYVETCVKVSFTAAVFAWHTLLIVSLLNSRIYDRRPFEITLLMDALSKSPY